MSRGWVLGVFLSAFVGCKGSSTGERQDTCREVRDKLVDLELDRRLRGNQRSRAPEREAIADKHRKNLRASLGDAFVERCALNESPAYLGCVLAAEESETALRCRREAAR